MSGFLEREAEGFRDRSVIAPRAAPVDLHPAAQQHRRVEPPKAEIASVIVGSVPPFP